MWIETRIKDADQPGRFLINIDNFIISPGPTRSTTTLTFFTDKRKKMVIETPFQFIYEMINPKSPMPLTEKDLSRLPIDN